MSKICNNCGNPMEETELFCTNCGSAATPVEEAPKAEAVPEAPVAVEEAPKADIAAKAKALLAKVQAYVEDVQKDPKKLIIPGAVLAALIVVVVLVSIFGGKAHYKPIDTYIDVLFNGKVNKLEQLAPAEYWDYVEDEMDMDLDDMIEELEDSLDDRMDDLEDEFGKHIKVKYEVTDEKELKEKKVEEIAEALEDQYDIDAKSVKKAYELEVELTIEGDEDDDDQETEMTVVKIGSKWYLISYYEYGDELFVSFMGASMF